VCERERERDRERERSQARVFSFACFNGLTRNLEQANEKSHSAHDHNGCLYENGRDKNHCKNKHILMTVKIYFALL